MADLQFHWNPLALLKATGSGGEDFTLLWFVRRRVRDVQATPHLNSFLRGSNHDSVSQRMDLDCRSVLRGWDHVGVSINKLLVINKTGW